MHRHVRRTLWIVLLPLSLGFALVVAGKWHSVSNLATYYLTDGPYINRVFSTESHVLDVDKAMFRRIVEDPEADDDRGHLPSFDTPVSSRLKIDASPEELTRYETFLNRFRALKAQADGPTDALADAVRLLVHETYWANRGEKVVDDASLTAIAEKDRYPENFIVGLVNYATSCGTISEATVALLRDAGFKTRLLRVANSPRLITANHVFVEYYSEAHQKWVMLDAMENFSPTRDGKPLSAFEFFAADDKKAIYAEVGVSGYIFDDDKNTIWFNKNGPVKNVYHFSKNQEVAAQLRSNLSS